MAATYLDLTCHIIFATKHRQPWIYYPRRGRLHAYMGGILRNAGASPIAIGGTADHAHLLVGLRGTQPRSHHMTAHWAEGPTQHDSHSKEPILPTKLRTREIPLRRLWAK